MDALFPCNSQAAQAPGWAHMEARGAQLPLGLPEGPQACLLHGEALALGPLLANITPRSLWSDFPGQTLTLFS